MSAAVLDEIVVPRHRGRTRSHPDAVIADRDYWVQVMQAPRTTAARSTMASW